MTFTTTAFDRSSSWLFEASPYRTAPKGPPSSFEQHGASRLLDTTCRTAASSAAAAGHECGASAFGKQGTDDHAGGDVVRPVDAVDHQDCGGVDQGERAHGGEGCGEGLVGGGSGVSAAAEQVEGTLTQRSKPEPCPVPHVPML
jgi:hypothetical protein